MFLKAAVRNLNIKRMGAEGSTLFAASAVGSLLMTSSFSSKQGSFLLTNSDSVSDAADVLKPTNDKNSELGHALIKVRNQQMGPNVSVFYKQDGGLVVTKGDGVFLEDVDGNRHLDCCNNVACVGHSHPAVVGYDSDQWPFLASCSSAISDKAAGDFPSRTQHRVSC